MKHLADDSPQLALGLVETFAEFQVPSETYAWPALEEIFGTALPGFADALKNDLSDDTSDGARQRVEQLTAWAEAQASAAP